MFGFVEPCSIGATLVFVKAIEGRSNAVKVWHVIIFALTRAMLIGILGMLAVAIGSTFLRLQKAAWLMLGMVFAAIGLLYLFGRAGAVMASLGPSLSSLSGLRGSVLLGMLFGLNIPACAAPLLFALLGAAVAGGSGDAAIASGFASLALFGLTLSLPLVIAVFIPGANRLLDRFAGLSRRLPK